MARTSHTTLFLLAALATGFVAGAAAYSLIGPDRAVIPEGVQIVLITVVAGAVGVAGVVTAATISADAQRHTAMITQQEAQEDRKAAHREAEAARRAAREAQFHDRIRTLAAQMIVSATRYRDGAANVSGLPASEQQARPLHLGRTLRETARELRMIVITQPAYDTALGLALAAENLMQFVYDKDGEIPPPELGNTTGLRFALRGVQAAVDAFEAAIRGELGAQPMPEPEG